MSQEELGAPKHLINSVYTLEIMLLGKQQNLLGLGDDTANSSDFFQFSIWKTVQEL